jgi:hypothetical protein
MFSKSILTSVAASLAIAGASLGVADAAWADPAATPITEAYAKAQIIGDNYTNVSDVRQTKDGWTAKADESGKPVLLLVDNMGDVMKQ